MNLGRAIRVIRAQRGLRQDELAGAAGLSPSYVSLIERGKREPSLVIVRKLASALGVPVDLVMVLAIEPKDSGSVSAADVRRLAEKLLRLAVVADGV